MDSRIQKGNAAIKDLDEIVYKNAKLYYNNQGEIEKTAENVPAVRLNNGVLVKFYDKNRNIVFQGKDELLESNLRKWDEFYDKQTRCESITIEVEEEGYKSIKKFYARGKDETIANDSPDFDFELDKGVKIIGKRIEGQEKYEIVFQGPNELVLTEVDKWKEYAITSKGEMIEGTLKAAIIKIFWG